MIVAGYIRVSGDSQTDEHGPERQAAEIERFCRARGWVAALYFDTFTGTDTSRPQWDEMIAWMRESGVTTIVCESLHRLARKGSVQDVLLTNIGCMGGSLWACDSGQDEVAQYSEDNPMARAMVQMKGVFNELDRNQIVHKLKTARNAKKAVIGHCGGRRPYGAWPSERETLRLILDLHEVGYGNQEIADRLNEDGKRPRTAASWHRNQVRNAIKNAGKAERILEEYAR